MIVERMVNVNGDVMKNWAIVIDNVNAIYSKITIWFLKVLIHLSFLLFL